MQLYRFKGKAEPVLLMIDNKTGITCLVQHVKLRHFLFWSWISWRGPMLEVMESQIVEL